MMGLIVTPVPSLDGTKTPLTSENGVPGLPISYFNNHWQENLQFDMGSNWGNFAHFRRSKPFVLPISG